MTARTELVTTALLGTDRRGFGEATDPASALLAEAARSAVAWRAGTPLPAVAAPTDRPTGPRTPVAPEPAQQLLTVLLERPVVGLIASWLATAVRQGRAAAPRHWDGLLRLAYGHPTLDRRLLAYAIGAHGIWFAGQNPRWQRLSGELRAVDLDQDPTSVAISRPTLPTAGWLGQQPMAADAEALFRIPDPWPAEVTDAALAVVAGGILLGRTGAYAAEVALRVPLPHYPRIRELAEQQARSTGDWSTARVVRDALAQLDRTVYLRLEITRAFAAAAAPEETS